MMRTKPVRAAFDAGSTNGRVWEFCAIEGIDAAARMAAKTPSAAILRMVLIMIQSPIWIRSVKTLTTHEITGWTIQESRIVAQDG